MYPISPIFADYLKRHDKQYIVKAVIDGTEYSSASIVEFSIENVMAGGEEFEIGTANPSKLTIKLRLPDAIKPNAKIIPYLSLSLDSMNWLEAVYPWEQMDIPWTAGATEWLPLGEFYVDSREKINDVWTYICCDKLITTEVAYISQLNYPATQKAVFDEICNRIGLVYDSSVVINPNYKIQAGPAGYSCRQVLAYIAGANSASIFMGKDGVMRFKRFSASAPAVFEMTTADYIRVKQTNPVKTYTRIVVTYNTEDKLTFEAGTGDDNHTLYLENPFMTQSMVNALFVSLNGLSYLPLTMDSRGFPQLDQGDMIGFEQREGGSWIDTNTPWQEMNIPWDGIMRYTSFILRQTYSFKGGLTHKIEAPSTSEQQSEFALEGSLTQQVNKLNENAIRYGKPYFGITHSRTEGIVVEREDHKSKLTLNSDVMDWRVNGQSSLYYDAQANKLKYTGHLEAATGTFSGDLKAAGGTFTGTLQGVDGTFSGNLQAASGTFKGNLQAAGGTFTGTLDGVDGNFSGTITASTIIGGQINGTRIVGAEIMTSEGSYPRAEMSSSQRMFGAWSSSNNGIEMRSVGSNSLSELRFTNGGAFASMSLPGSGLLLDGSRLTMEFMEIYMRGYNGVTVPGWDRLRSEDDGESMRSALNRMNDLAYNMTFDNATRNLKLWSRNGSLLAQVNIPK
ncbi:polymer-forming cytoskeletal protein [Paenibacillus sp. FSL K6-2524]|uniref:polymer-forming cytoskeletal protein n=1 Tax=Paenibacillus sp. FSL K6-2524 TaxID=2954516 RepID=UPI0030F8586C